MNHLDKADLLEALREAMCEARREAERLRTADAEHPTRWPEIDAITKSKVCVLARAYAVVESLSELAA